LQGNPLVFRGRIITIVLKISERVSDQRSPFYALYKRGNLENVSCPDNDQQNK
jgi:hypothetical protein